MSAAQLRKWTSPSRQLVAVGLAAVLLHVGVVSTAMAGLAEVEESHLVADELVVALRDYQDADMAHDRLRGDAVMVLADAEGAPWATDGPGGVAALERSVADFRSHLAAVDRAPLPPDLAADVRRLRPLQEQFAADGERLAEVAADLPAARRQMGTLEGRFQLLVREQGELTRVMRERVAELRGENREDERAVFWRLLLSAAAALAGLLGLTWLLHRLGSALASLLARERGVAETLQTALLPDRLPELPGLRFAARYLPSSVGTQVGGDWYDVISLPAGRVGLVMGDVVGHDLRAAADMGQLRNALRTCAADGADAHEVLHRLNRLSLLQDFRSMATVLYAVLDPVAATVQVANAGHYPPLLVTAEGSRYLEGAPCPPIAAVRGAEYRSTEHALPADSVLLLYTDGLVERRDTGVEPGLAQLRELMALTRPVDLGSPQSLDGLCDRVLDGMLAGREPDDDVAMLVVAPQAVLGPLVDVVWPAQAEQLGLLRHLLERWLVEAGATEEEVYDIVVACSEAATNAIEHAYGPGEAEFRTVCSLDDGVVTISLRDWGQWREPRGRDRGRGLGLMEGLMDSAEVTHGARGTEVTLRRRLGRVPEPRRLVST